MITFNFKNGTSLSPSEAGFTGDARQLILTNRAIQLFIKHNDVTFDPGYFTSILKVNDKSYDLGSCYNITYGVLLEAFELNEKRLASVVKGFKLREEDVKYAERFTFENQIRVARIKNAHRLAKDTPIIPFVDFVNGSFDVNESEEIRAKRAAKIAEGLPITEQRKAKPELAEINECVGLRAILKNFNTKINGIGSNYSDAKKVAVDLAENLDQVVAKFVNKDIDAEQFKKETKDLVDAAFPILERDLSWGDYLINMLKHLCNAVTYVVTVSVAPNSFFLTTKKSEGAVAATEVLNSLNKAAGTDAAIADSILSFN
ncbi:MAG: hypothetical protein EPN84_00255 [Legionella sp.]|nr:MAG: hypothetical protein EPN84_00255 [Legionella sp.]